MTSDSPRIGSFRALTSRAVPTVVAVLVLTGLAAVAYHNSFSVPFVLDDVTAVQIDNPTIQRLSRIWDVLSPPATSGIGGRPLVNLTLAINFAFGGFEDVRGYHVMNLAIHVVAGLALFGLVRRTFRLVRWPDSSPATDWLALALTGLWLVHPLQTEAVTYISQRTEALMALFYLLTLYCFVRSVEGVNRVRWQIGSVAACLLGVLSKEVIVTAPVAVLLFDRTFVSGTFRDAWRRHARYYVGLALTWIVLAVLMWDVAQRGVGFGYDVGVWEYALTSCRSVVEYLRIAFWPHPLVLDYGTDTIRHVGEAAPFIVAVLALLAATLFALRRRPVAGFFAASVFLALAPTTSFVPVAMQPMAEHRMYLPLAAVIVGLGCDAWRRFGPRTLVGCAILIAIGVGLTVHRNRDYRSELSIWEDTVAKVPDNGRAHSNLGTLLMRAGRAEAAIPEFEAALRPGMKYPIEARANYGTALFRAGRFADALRQFQLVVDAIPHDPLAQFNLSTALLALGRRDDALAATRTALRLGSRDASLLNKIGRNFVTLDRPDEAISAFREALRLVPAFAAARSNLGTALLNAGRAAEALPEFQAAKKLEPRDGSIRYNLGTTLRELDRPDEALFELREAVRLAPQLAPAHLALANLLAAAKMPDEAIAHYREALRLRPNDADAHNDFGGTLAELGRVREAEREFEEALRLQPDHAAARRNLAQLRGQ